MLIRTTHTHTFSAIRVAAGLAVILAASVSLGERVCAVPPQPPVYRVTDIVDLGGTYVAVSPNDPTHADGTIGINDKGQIVYSRIFSSHNHAFVWLPETDYGFTANVVHTLDSSSNDSIARDINENGKVAGFSGSTRAATVWTLSGGSVSATTQSDTPGEAFALSNDSPPNVVGWRTISGDCGLGNIKEEAMLWPVGGTTISLVPLAGTPHEDEFSTGYDIRRNGTDLVVGLSEECFRIGNYCYEKLIGTSWNASQVASALPYDGIRPLSVEWQSRPYGINDSGNVVGWVYFDVDDLTIGCDVTAAFWEDSTDDAPIDLSAYINDALSRAFAINDASPPEVVGSNEQTNDATLWTYGSPWTALNLNNSGSPDYAIPECSDDEWDVYEAHDNNDDGWIVAFGSRVVGMTTEQHVLLLTPIGCPWDVNEDESIDEYDLAAIIASAGACVPAVICRGDIDFDCDVDRDDGILLLIYLNECPSDPCPCEFGESMAMTQGGGLSAERFAAAIAATPSLSSEAIAQAWTDFLAVYASNSN